MLFGVNLGRMTLIKEYIWSTCLCVIIHLANSKPLTPKNEVPPGGCFAVAGPGRGKECIFPFTFQGKVNEACVGSKTVDPKGKWCATELNEKGEFDEGKGFGYCGEDCPGVKPDNYTRLGDGGFYKINNIKASQKEAASACQSEGAHLAVDDAASAAVMSHYDTGKSGKGSDRYWIGGTYSEKDGGWHWPDGSPIEDAKWSSGQPDNRDGDENCMTTNFRSKERWFDSACGRQFPSLCQQTHVTNGFTLSMDIHGDYAWATQWEDDIALKIYEKWLKAAGGEKGMECSRLRSVVHVFGDAPVEWDELTKDAIGLAKHQGKWPKVCDYVKETVKDCKEALGGVADAKNISEGFDMINRWVVELKKGQMKFLAGVEQKTCKDVLLSFIDQAFKFKTNIQETINCMPEIPECVASVNKHKEIYKKFMYQSMRKGRAKSKEAKTAAKAKLGDQSKLSPMTKSGGISQAPQNTPEKLKNFFKKKMIHGKRFMQRDVSDIDENPAKVFALAQAPFIGGLSGSILEIFRLVDAYVGKKYTLGEEEVVMEKVDDKLGLLFMALLDLGGHHSITETGIAAHEWGLLKDVTVPFTADTDLRDMEVECREKLPNKYLNFLRSLEDVVDKLEY